MKMYKYEKNGLQWMILFIVEIFANIKRYVFF